MNFTILDNHLLVEKLSLKKIETIGLLTLLETNPQRENPPSFVTFTSDSISLRTHLSPMKLKWVQRGWSKQRLPHSSCVTSFAFFITCPSGKSQLGAHLISPFLWSWWFQFRPIDADRFTITTKVMVRNRIQWPFVVTNFFFIGRCISFPAVITKEAYFYI